MNYTNRTPVVLLTKKRRRRRSPSSDGGAVAAYRVAGETRLARPAAVTCAAVVTAGDDRRGDGLRGVPDHWLQHRTAPPPQRKRQPWPQHPWLTTTTDIHRYRLRLRQLLHRRRRRHQHQHRH